MNKKSNILFYCRTSKTHFMFHLAKIFKEKGVLGEASAFVAYYDEWKNFLETRRDVSFNRIYGSKEIFQRMGSAKVDETELKRIESTYGDQEIWNIVYSDAIICHHLDLKPWGHPKWSKKDIYLYVQLCFQYVEKMLDETKLDFIVDFASVNTFRGILDLVARHRGIPYLWPSGTVVLKDRFIISDRGWDNYERIKKCYKALRETKDSYQEGWNYLHEFREKASEKNFSSYRPLKIDTKRPFGWNTFVARQKNNWQQIRKEWDLRKRAKKDPSIYFNFQLFKMVPSILFYREFLGFFRQAYVKWKRVFQDDDLPENYVFLTLHQQPEASTSIKAPYFVNELNFIQNVSRTLPLNWKLVVKAHPRMTKNKPIYFYKMISKIPNVCFVSPEADTMDLIRKSKAVVAITGTSGFEALLLGKKVFVFGKTVWNAIRGVTECNDFSELHSMLKESVYYKTDDEDIATYLQAVHNCTFSFDAYALWKAPYNIHDPEYYSQVQIVAEAILKRYNELNQEEGVSEYAETMKGNSYDTV